jgi:hypothetical protein
MFMTHDPTSQHDEIAASEPVIDELLDKDLDQVAGGVRSNEVGLF